MGKERSKTRLTCDVSPETLVAIDREIDRRGLGQRGRNRLLEEGIEMLLRAPQPLDRFLEQARSEIVLVGITLPWLDESAIQELLRNKVKAGVNVTITIADKSLLEFYERQAFGGIAIKEWELACATALDLMKVPQQSESQVRLLEITRPPLVELVYIDPFSFPACQVAVSIFSDAHYPTRPEPLYQVSGATSSGQLLCQKYLGYYMSLSMTRKE